MYLDEAYLNLLRGKDLILPTKKDYSRLHVYLRGQVLATITTDNVDKEAMRLDQFLETKDIDTGTRGLSHELYKIKSELKGLGLTVEIEVDQKTLNFAKDVYNKTIGERIDAFRKELYEHYGVTDNPKADAVYDKAYDMGHSAGFGEVSAHFGDLVDLIVD